MVLPVSRAGYGLSILVWNGNGTHSFALVLQNQALVFLLHRAKSLGHEPGMLLQKISELAVARTCSHETPSAQSQHVAH